MERTLAGTLRQFVSAASRGRGESYYERGRVLVLHAGTTEFTANVRGTRLYGVSLRLPCD